MAENGLDLSLLGTLQLQHQYILLPLWSHAEIQQGFIECRSFAFRFNLFPEAAS